MAITQKFSSNSAIQYNESLDDYKINDIQTARKFLTLSPLNRLINENELSALYFLIDDSAFVGSTLLKFKDADGVTIYEDINTISSTYNIHNGLAIGFENVPYYVPSNTKKICAVLTSAVNLFLNSDFSLGSGNLFTSWTLTQPSRTNLLLRSQEFDNASWTKANITITANSTLAPDGTLTADTQTEANLNSSFHTDSSNITVVSGSTYTMSIYAKMNGRRYVLLYEGFSDIGVFFDLQDGVALGSLGAGTLVGSFIDLDENGFYRISVTYVQSGTTASLQTYLSANGTGVSYVGNGTSGIYTWGAQLELGTYATPYIPTTNVAVTTSLGEFLQDATGGLNGGRCLKMWVYNGGATLNQAVPLVNGANYTLKFWARVDTLNNDYVTGPAESTLINSTEWKQYTQTFSWIGTGTFPIYLDYANDANYGFVYLDDVKVYNSAGVELTEERCFILDEACPQYETQLQWINKLGGVDTWTFTGASITSKQTERGDIIERSMIDNFTAPNAIFENRTIKSFESKAIVHRCVNEETAEWLRSELIDSIAVFQKVGEEFYPILVTNTSVQIGNEAQRNYFVRLNYRFAFDVNIQSR